MYLVPPMITPLAASLSGLLKLATRDFTSSGFT